MGSQAVTVLDQGGVMAKAKLNINIDGSGRAYNWDNTKGLIHLCNAAKVYPAGGTPYQGSVDNATCTGRFMTDLARIKAAGWTDGSVGAIEWYGVAATGTATDPTSSWAGRSTHLWPAARRWSARRSG